MYIFIIIFKKAKTGKVNVCHYDADTDTWKTLNINGNALEAHLNHGDVSLVDADGDGYVQAVNECVPGGDCDDTNADINPDAEEINDGLDKLLSLGYKPSGFIAPGWLASAGTKQAISEIGFSYTTSHLLISDLLFEKRHFAPVICQRPNAPTTRVVMLMTTLLAEILMALRLPLRIAVHPEDLHDAKLRKRILKIISRAVVNGYQSITYDQFVSNTHKRNKIPTGLNDSMSFA